MSGRSCACAVKIWLKIALNAVRLPKFESVNGISWSPRKMRVKDLRQRSGLAWFCACADSCVAFNTGPYTVLPKNSILIRANMQSETGFPSSHQLKSYVAYKSRLKLAALTACTSGSAPGPTLGIEYGKAFTFIFTLWTRGSGATEGPRDSPGRCQLEPCQLLHNCEGICFKTREKKISEQEPSSLSVALQTHNFIRRHRSQIMPLTTFNRQTLLRHNVRCV